MGLGKRLFDVHGSVYTVVGSGVPGLASRPHGKAALGLKLSRYCGLITCHPLGGDPTPTGRTERGPVLSGSENVH